MPIVTKNLNTAGMHCGSCSMLIDMTLSELNGVESSKSDAATGSTVVTFDSETVDLPTLIGAIQAAGYEAEEA